MEFSPEWFEKNGIEALYGWKVKNVDFSSKTVTAENGEEEKQLEYERLIIASGARPWAPPIEGMDSEGVFFLRTIDDLKAIEAWRGSKKKAAIIGAGLIGLESAESLVKLGLEVEVFEFLPYALPAMIDEDLAVEIDSIMRGKSVKAHYSAEVIRIKGNPVSSLFVKDRESGEITEMNADMVIVSTGNTPNTEIFQGIEKGKKGHIRVNERSETSIPDIYAAGDCTEYTDFVTRNYVPMGMGTMAVRQGMAAGINAAGGDFSIHPFIGVRTTEIFGTKIAAVGATSHILEVSGIEHVTAKFKGKNLPEYFESSDVYVKVIAAADGKILGAQILGASAPWKISMFAEAMLRGDTAGSLSKVETPYAPPIAPTLDAVSIACSTVDMKLRRRR